MKEDKAFGSSLKKIVEWQVKNDFLKNQISVLEKTKNYPIFEISCFILKCQLIEFELKQVLSNLDFHLHHSVLSKILNYKMRSPKDFDEKKYTLGKLNDELKKYSGESLNDLKQNLSELVRLRNNFVHALFNPGTIEDMIKDADKGLVMSNKVINDIEKLNKLLDKKPN